MANPSSTFKDANDTAFSANHAAFDANYAAFNTNQQTLDFASSGNPSTGSEKARDPTYTPEQMKQVLAEALSPQPTTHLSNLSFQSRFFEKESSPATEDVEAGEEDNDALTEPFHALTDTPSRDESVYDTKISNTPRLLPESSPVRPLPSPSPFQISKARTFAVEASFLQAMSGVLERQANIVPDHMLTQSEVRHIVRSELKKRDDAKAARDKGDGHDGVTELAMLNRRMNVVGLAVALIGLATCAAFKRMGEMPWCARGALGGGFLGLVAMLGGNSTAWTRKKTVGGGAGA